MAAVPYYQSLRYRTNLASLLLDDPSDSNKKIAHVYYQAQNGDLWETSRPDGGQWTDLPLVHGPKIMMGTPLAAIAWARNGQSWRRCFYISRDLKLGDMIFKPGASAWEHGTLLEKGHLATAQSHLSAVTYTDPNDGYQYTYIHYENRDNWKIQELKDSGSWDGSGRYTLLKEYDEPLHGTGIAYVNRGTASGAKFHSIHQVQDGSLRDMYWSGRGAFKTGTLNLPLAKSSFLTPIAATGLTLPSTGTSFLQLFYYSKERNGICRRAYVEGKGWTDDGDEQLVIRDVVPGAGIAASSASTANAEVRLYVTTSNNAMVELKMLAVRDFGLWELFDYSRSIIPCGTKRSIHLQSKTNVDTATGH